MIYALNLVYLDLGKSIGSTLKHLNENSIKKATLRFLKNYYKFRPRSQYALFQLDQETRDGIKADGYLSYPQEDGTHFVVTFEATAHETRDEVIFKKQERVLFWDSLAAAFILAAVLSGLNHHYDLYTINKVGWLISIFSFFITLFVGMLLYRWLAGGLERYRYIYAVEQFKRYHANEQWIAIADDVFDGPVDPLYEELKKQCVRNGFGLIHVDRFQEANALVTPSRQELFGQRRASRQFASRDQALERSRREKLRGWWNRALAFITGRRSENAILRYQRTYWNQMLICAVGLLIVGGIFYQEAQESPILSVDEDAYEQGLSDLAKRTRAETDFYVVDSSLVEPAKGETEPYLDASQDNSGQVEGNQRYGEIYISTGDGNFVIYDCERFFNYSGTKYVIQEGTYQSLEAANARTGELYQKGINANSLWMGCFGGETENYVVFVDFLFNTVDEADIVAGSYRNRFKRNPSLSDLDVVVRSISL